MIIIDRVDGHDDLGWLGEGRREVEGVGVLGLGLTLWAHVLSVEAATGDSSLVSRVS